MKLVIQGHKTYCSPVKNSDKFARTG